MKIDINKIKLTPKSLGFNFCQYGKISDEIKEWSNFWNFKIQEESNYTNIIIDPNVDMMSIFEIPKKYEFLDGISPNLCKKLHLGHLSNFVIAKSFQYLEISNKYISILGDTTSGDIDKEKSILNFNKMCDDFEYKIDKTYFASEMKLLDNSILSEGDGDYLGTKIFNILDEKVVGIKSSGKTTYFYQDVSLAQELNSNTLYLTGQEQESHFKLLKSLFPNSNHIPLGLVLFNGKKMSTSEGNVIYIDDLFNQLLEIFNNDKELVYNILACQILKSSPTGNKSINTDIISNPKLSPGLYLSYTLAHVKSCGVSCYDIDKFGSNELCFNYIKSKSLLQPNILLDSLMEHAKKINNLYSKLYIKDNKDNIKIFSNLISDLKFGMKKLGLFDIEKV